jgi:hypothetical protein
MPTGNVVKSLERKLDDEAGRAALKPATLPDGRLPKADTTVGVELDWLRDVRSPLIPTQTLTITLTPTSPNLARTPSRPACQTPPTTVTPMLSLT